MKIILDRNHGNAEIKKEKNKCVDIYIYIYIILKMSCEISNICGI